MSLALSRNSLSKIVPPDHLKNIQLGSGYFFYTISGLYIGALVLLILTWAEALMSVAIMSILLFGLCLYSKSKFPWYCIGIPALAGGQILLALTANETEFIQQANIVEKNKSSLEVEIYRSLGIKNEVLVLQGQITGSDAIFELRVPPLTISPVGKQKVRVQSYSRASKFGVSRGISLVITGDLIPSEAIPKNRGTIA
jgi:hypothetical protein